MNPDSHSTKPITLAVLGCGVISHDHIRAYRQIPGVYLKTVCDPIPGKAAARAEEYGVPFEELDADTVLADPEIDAVSICTDHLSHAALTVAALNAGKHVITEKPLAAARADMDRMIAAAKCHPELVCTCIFQNRFDPVNRHVKRLLEHGVFGTVLQCSLNMRCFRSSAYYENKGNPWRGKWTTEGGSVLMNQAIHSIDLQQWFMDGVREVMGFSDNLVHKNIIETEDVAAAALRFNNGALGTILATSGSHLDWEPDLAIYGTQASVEIRANHIQRFTASAPSEEARILAEFEALKEKHTPNPAKAYYGVGHPSQLADFIDAIRFNRPPDISLEEARIAVDIAQTIYGR